MGRHSPGTATLALMCLLGVSAAPQEGKTKPAASASIDSGVKGIANYSQAAGQTRPPAKPGEGQARIVLPAKLIISASKEQLNQVGSGKLSFEEFKKAASVQYLTFKAAAKEPKVNPPAAGKTP